MPIDINNQLVLGSSLNDDTHALKHQLITRLDAKTARFGIVGMGYVGLPLMLAITDAGFAVTGFDIRGDHVDALNDGRSPLAHIEPARIQSARDRGLFEASADFDNLAACAVIIICVPTPLGQHREPDLSFVEATGRTIAAGLTRGQVIILESTTYPGTTDEVLRPILETSGLKSGEDFFLGYSPERENPGDAVHMTATIPKVVGGDGEIAKELMGKIYGRFVTFVVPVSSTRAAEAVKLTENIFRSVNIALVNELKVVFEKMDINIFEVIEAAASKPFGYMPFYPGPGLGGHCIPIDPFYLTWKAREHDVATRFIELAGEINHAMPGYAIERLSLALDEQANRGLKGSRILVIGAAYKKNVDDMRESPALEIMSRLAARGALVLYHDPHVPVIPLTRQHPNLRGMQSVPLTAQTIQDAEAIMIITDHDQIDWPLVADKGSLIIDTRNALAAFKDQLGCRLYLA